MIEKDLKFLVKSCPENRKPIRDGYIWSRFRSGGNLKNVWWWYSGEWG